MTDLEFTIRAICKRRGVTLSKIESVAFNCIVSFGLANNTYLVSVVANTFYFFDSLQIYNNATGAALFLMAPNSGQGSVGASTVVAGATQQYRHIELDSLQYNVGTHSAGSIYLYGTLFKITTV